MAWQERTIRGIDDFDIFASRFINDFRQRTQMVVDGSEHAPGHAVQPRIDVGLVAYLQTPDLGTAPPREVRVRRFDEQPQQGAWELHPSRRVTSASEGVSALQLARDRNSSHWAVVYIMKSPLFHRAQVARIGHRGGATEIANVFGTHNAPPIAPAVTYLPNDSFRLAYGSGSGLSERYALYLHDFHNPFVTTTHYGVACGPGQIEPKTPSFAGTDAYRVELSNHPNPQPAVLLVSLASADLALDGIGMEGCRLNVDAGASLVATLPLRFDAFPPYTAFPLPDVPLFIGDLYLQWLYLSPNGSTTLGVEATFGLKVEVR